MRRVWYSLYDRLLSVDALREAFRKVKLSRGAPGVDGESVYDFDAHREANLAQLVEELRTKTYRPKPVRRVEIPKPTGGVRLLGIPAVRDRVVQQALLDLLTPIFDPVFHPSSYAYRPGRSCHDAIEQAIFQINRKGRCWVVDMDLSKCFDRLDHDLIIEFLREKIADGSILGLIRQFLTSGVMKDGQWTASELGSPQGGVISPLIANVYLNAFDREMTRLGYRHVRYADDILILCGSRRSAERALWRATAYLEGPLRLQVNRKKTAIEHSDQGVPFLGVVLHTRYISIAKEKEKRLREKVKAITRRRRPGDLKRVLHDLNPVLRGFGQYFRIANCAAEFRALMSWVRRRLRMLQLVWWKKPKKLVGRLRYMHYSPLPTWVNMRAWRSSIRRDVQHALPNKYYAASGLFDLTKLPIGSSVLGQKAPKRR